MKRYVLTKDDKTIRLSTPDDERNANVDKNSDNLIDLAEAGDMVEIIDEQGLDYVHLTEKWTVSEIMEDFEIIALWKRNGDIMRRYRVE